MMLNKLKVQVDLSIVILEFLRSLITSLKMYVFISN